MVSSSANIMMVITTMVAIWCDDGQRDCHVAASGV